jgi:hypothetical protein
VLFVGDDWAEAHHDIEIEDEAGRVLARRRLPEGLAGITMLHELVAEHLDPAAEPDQVLIGIETERGPWVQALLAAGYVVFAINPLQVARVSGTPFPVGGRVGCRGCGDLEVFSDLSVAGDPAVMPAALAAFGTDLAGRDARGCQRSCVSAWPGVDVRPGRVGRGR